MPIIRRAIYQAHRDALRHAARHLVERRDSFEEHPMPDTDFTRWLMDRITYACDTGELWMIDPLQIERAWVARA